MNDLCLVKGGVLATFFATEEVYKQLYSGFPRWCLRLALEGSTLEGKTTTMTSCS